MSRKLKEFWFLHSCLHWRRRLLARSSLKLTDFSVSGGSGVARGCKPASNKGEKGNRIQMVRRLTVGWGLTSQRNRGCERRWNVGLGIIMPTWESFTTSRSQEKEDDRKRAKRNEYDHKLILDQSLQWARSRFFKDIKWGTRTTNSNATRKSNKNIVMRKRVECYYWVHIFGTDIQCLTSGFWRSHFSSEEQLARGWKSG